MKERKIEKKERIRIKKIEKKNKSLRKKETINVIKEKKE